MAGQWQEILAGEHWEHDDNVQLQGRGDANKEFPPSLNLKCTSPKFNVSSLGAPNRPSAALFHFWCQEVGFRLVVQGGR